MIILYQVSKGNLQAYGDFPERVNGGVCVAALNLTKECFTDP